MKNDKQKEVKNTEIKLTEKNDNLDLSETKVTLTTEEIVKIEDLTNQLDLEQAKMNACIALISKKYQLPKGTGFSDDGRFFLNQKPLPCKMTKAEQQSITESSLQLDVLKTNQVAMITKLKIAYNMPAASSVDKETWTWVLPSGKPAKAYK